MNSKKLNFLWFCLIATFWGGSYVAIKYAVTYFPPFFSAALRVIIAFCCLSIFFVTMKKNTAIPFSIRWKVWMVGLFSQGFPFAALFWGERFVSPGLAGILTGFTPIWTFILSIFFLRQYTSVSFLKILGLLLGIAGIFIIFWPMLSFEGSGHEIIGSFAVLLMAFFYAVGAIMNQHLFAGQKISFQANLFHQHLASATFLVLLSFLFEKWPSVQVVFHSPTLWLASIYLGVFSTALAWMLYYHLIREWGAIRASSTTYVAPIMAVFWDFIFFKHYPSVTEVMGVITILLGVVLVQFAKA